jgi:hypothetical protein
MTKCISMTLSGEPCKNKASMGKQCCYLHKIHEITTKLKCLAMTLSGEQCKRNATIGKQCCYSHSKHCNKEITTKSKCIAMTLLDKPCNRNASSGNQCCYLHQQYCTTVPSNLLKKLMTTPWPKSLKVVYFPTGNTRAIKDIHKLAKSDKCSASITDTYIEKAIQSANGYFIMYKNNFMPVAFAIIQDNYDCTQIKCSTNNSSSTMFISAMCGGEYMKYILAYIIEYAITIDKHYIVVSSLGEVILWYQRFGFGFYINNTLDAQSEKRLTQLSQRKYIDPLIDKDFVALLKLLEEKNLATGKLEVPVCKGINIFNNNNCYEHGYLMKLDLTKLVQPLKKWTLTS